MNRSGLLLVGVAVVFSVAGLAAGYWLGRTATTAPSAQGGGDQASRNTTPGTDEVKWAREVADRYLLSASQNGFYHAAASAWVSQAFKERLARADLADYRFTGWKIEEGNASPRRDEVLFRGQLKATWATSSRAGAAALLASPLDLAFTLRVAPDPPGGQWRVDWAQFDDDKPRKK